MVISLEQRVQRGHIFAIVDEVDSVLIDEARTPLIISGPVGNESDAQYFEHNAAVSRLVRKQTELVNVLVAEGERLLEAGDTSGRRAQALPGATRPPEEQAPDQAAARAGQQAARAEDGARAHRRPQAAAVEAAVPRRSRTSSCSCSTRRGTPCTSPIVASSSCRRRITTRSCSPTLERGRPPDRPRSRAHGRGEDRRATRARDRLRGQERAAEHRAPAAARRTRCTRRT